MVYVERGACLDWCGCCGRVESGVDLVFKGSLDPAWVNKIMMGYSKSKE